MSITVADPDHSAREERFILIDHSARQHLVVVAHVERDDTIRIISARPASPRERVTYEERERRTATNGVRSCSVRTEQDLTRIPQCPTLIIPHGKARYADTHIHDANGQVGS